MLSSKRRRRKGEGTLTANIPIGDLFLTDAEGKSYRLSWSGKGRARRDPRVLPAGTYRLRTYRIERVEKRVHWHISATAATLQKIEIVEGKVTRLDVDPRIHLASQVTGKRGAIKITGAGGASGAGLTIYRSGARIPMEYRLLGGDKTVLETGSMEYG